MRQFIVLAGAVALALLVFVPFAAAADADSLPRTGRVLVSVQGDVTLPAGEQAEHGRRGPRQRGHPGDGEDPRRR